MAEQCLIDGEQLFRFLSDQLTKETGSFSKGVNKGLDISRSAIHNVDVVKPIDPETLPIVRQLREELARVKNEREAAIKELDGVLSLVDDLVDFVDREIHPVVDYNLYLDLREHVDAVSMFQYENEWRGPQKEDKR